MTTVYDVAAYILAQCGAMTAMKLQKLVYYCQAWSLVWDERPMFGSAIEAGANGPVVRDLYEQHRGMFTVSNSPSGDPSALDKDARETVDAVLRTYGDKTSQWLSNLTHQERPWRDARGNLGPNDRGEREITHAAMAEYYGSLA